MTEQLKERLKIERGVFDSLTLQILYDLLNKGILKEVTSIIKEGKESGVFLGKGKDGRNIAIKIYRTDASNFKSMWKYLIDDSRFTRIKKDKRYIVNQWCLREYKNLVLAYKAGATVQNRYWREVMFY